MCCVIAFPAVARRTSIRQADPVEQAGLSVVYVAHHTVTTGGRGFRFFLGLRSLAPREPFLLRGTTTLTTPVKTIGHRSRRGLHVQRLVDAGEHAANPEGVSSKDLSRETSSFSASSRIVMPSVNVISRGGARLGRRDCSQLPLRGPACSGTLPRRVAASARLPSSRLSANRTLAVLDELLASVQERALRARVRDHATPALVLECCPLAVPSEKPSKAEPGKPL